MARNKLPVLLPAAKRDIKKAYEWYEEQRPGLGDQFLKRVEDCLRAIRRSPKAFQPRAARLYLGGVAKAQSAWVAPSPIQRELHHQEPLLRDRELVLRST